MGDSAGRTGLWIGFGLIALLLPLPFLGNLREQVVPYISLTTAATLLLYGGIVWLRRRSKSIRPRDVLLVAVLLRAVVFPLEPSLSDDAWRYLWDGRLVANGISPYHHVPADPTLTPWRDELYGLQGYPETNTIYPPIAQLIFAGAAAFDSAPGSEPVVLYLLYKLLLIAAELGAIILLLRILGRLRLPATGAILYAWHPLVVVELAGQGHTDAFWVLALGLALSGFLLGRPGRGLPGLAFGVGTRLFPLLAMPLWLRFVERGRRPIGLLLALPFLLLLYPLLDPDAFSRYSTVAARFTNFYEFNGGVYFGIKGILDALHFAPSNAIAGGITTGLMLAGIAVVTLWPIRKRTVRALVTRMLAIVTLQIALGAKVHVWYFVVPLYLLSLWPERRLLLPWVWATLIAPLTYLYYVAEPFGEKMWAVALEWGGFALLLCAGYVAAMKGERERRD